MFLKSWVRNVGKTKLVISRGSSSSVCTIFPPHLFCRVGCIREDHKRADVKWAVIYSIGCSWVPGRACPWHCCGQLDSWYGVSPQTTVLFAEECPERDSPSSEPRRDLCQWSQMAVISQGGPAELPTAVFICSQKEHGLIACEKQRAGGSKNSLFSFCFPFLAHGACVGMVSSFLGGDGVLPGLAQETDDQKSGPFQSRCLARACCF